MQLQEALAEVKSHLGKVVYKGDFLPLLRKYRQDQDTLRLTAGLREIAAPLLPNHRLMHSLATLLPSALQQAFLHQLKTARLPKPPEDEQSSAACSVRHVKRQRLSQASEQPPAHVLTDSIHTSDQDDTSLHMPKALAAQQHALCDNHTARDPADTPICAQAAGHPAVTSQLEELTAPGQGLTTAKPVCENKHFPDAPHQEQPVEHQASVHAPADSPPGTANTQLISAAATQFRGNVKRVKDAESFQRQKERRQKKAAFLLDGTTTRPIVGVAKGGSWGHAAQQHAIKMQSGQIVQLPVRPNRSQVLLMQSITVALLQKRHALLESPTGTGKTLALLCATLAWQQQQAHLAHRQPDAPAPRVFWAARTHAQIDHTVHEVRRTSYRPMMTILASRERFCLHPDIATAPNKTEACEGATMVGHMDCSYLENAEASWYPQGPEHLPAYKPGGRLETFDIEELVAEGRAGHVCPYHASRDVLNEGAALVFVTYSQLLDPPVRSANGLDDLLQGAVLVFDEAHNIAAECRAAATLQMSTDDLQALALDLGGMQGSLNKMAPASRQWRQAADWARELAHLVDTMQTWLARQLSSTSLPFQKEQGLSNSRAAIEVWEGTGPDAYTAVIHHLNLSIHRVETLQGRLKAMRRGLIEGGFESTAVKSGAINQLEALLSKLLFVLQTRGLGYRCILTRHSTAGKARRAQKADNGVQPSHVRSQYASLHQGVELVSAPHHHTLPARLLPLTISMAPGADGQLVKLDSAYERRQDAGYLDALGNAMLAMCQAIPNGVLCFFPSWGLLNAARDQWLVTGLWQQLSACKEVVTEPTNVSGEVFDEAIKSYRQAAATGQGAVLLAVMRGRSSEGVDFLDDCARAVVVVGIPYPPLYETSVRLKRVFNHDHEALLGSGDDWYAAEAFRAVNQAIGRLIRHQKDYGCVLLLDHRYNMLKFRQLTPAWLQPLLKSAAMADAPALLQNFFAGRC
ncbi:hypothetical protein WJX79_009909 [Trebouxia sp. C0005]